MIRACLCLGPAILVGQTPKIDLKAEDAAIRMLVNGGDRLPTTDDRIAWTGAQKRPSIGSSVGELFSAAEVSKRKNSKSRQTIQRLEVSASGDMAWEYSLGSLDYDLDGPPPRHVSFEQGILRVWKKVGGQWKVAASFIRPLDVPFENPDIKK
jgi:ketosteroid isomerase-like protein